ncbi:Oidioi.mRNA.OKI2018_I69.chr2.g5615.t1.cds [Oikopleura dioica]|uniref:Oidioi.mRNA.OKI2018_I69.chr2.g5615.t1.cds n=1 Tax=Oikopleura dioica TaxID=34765 RepID=A0ABN7T582_OIKDI|nr:Oidioi.mRNA.OKI2018_I69.chr2.g5615.t1.cds [Oikopleura dioica]
MNCNWFPAICGEKNEETESYKVTTETVSRETTASYFEFSKSVNDLESSLPQTRPTFMPESISVETSIPSSVTTDMNTFLSTSGQEVIEPITFLSTAGQELIEPDAFLSTPGQEHIETGLKAQTTQTSFVQTSTSFDMSGTDGTTETAIASKEANIPGWLIAVLVILAMIVLVVCIGCGYLVYRLYKCIKGSQREHDYEMGRPNKDKDRKNEHSDQENKEDDPHRTSHPKNAGMGFRDSDQNHRPDETKKDDNGDAGDETKKDENGDAGSDNSQGGNSSNQKTKKDEKTENTNTQDGGTNMDIKEEKKQTISKDAAKKIPKKKNVFNRGGKFPWNPSPKSSNSQPSTSFLAPITSPIQAGLQTAANKIATTLPRNLTVQFEQDNKTVTVRSVNKIEVKPKPMPGKVTKRPPNRPQALQQQRSESRRVSLPEPRPVSPPATRSEPLQESRPEPLQESRPEPLPEQRPEPLPQQRPEPLQESRPEPRPEPLRELRRSNRLMTPKNYVEFSSDESL